MAAMRPVGVWTGSSHGMAALKSTKSRANTNFERVNCILQENDVNCKKMVLPDDGERAEDYSVKLRMRRTVVAGSL